MYSANFVRCWLVHHILDKARFQFDYNRIFILYFRYLKHRQEEWKTQEKERKEAEMNANVPLGYVLLSDEERLDHLKTFKRSMLSISRL